MHTIDLVPGQKPLRRRLLLRTLLFAMGVGPLIGGSPFLIHVPPVLPFVYLFGVLPALLGGGLYGWLVARFAMRIRFGWWQRLLLGAGCGFFGSAAFSLLMLSPEKYLALAIFSVPAGALCALFYRRQWIDRDLFEPIPVIQPNGGNA